MATTTTCHWHPNRDTRLTCGNCGKPICTQCMRHHPVGIRCKECAGLARLPTYQVSASYAARGIGAMVGLGIAGGLVLLLVRSVLGSFAGFLFFFLMFGLGYALGEGVSAAVNRRRGKPYQYMAAGAVLIAASPILISLLLSLSISIGALFTLAGVVAAVAVAMSRLAP